MPACSPSSSNDLRRFADGQHQHDSADVDDPQHLLRGKILVQLLLREAVGRPGHAGRDRQRDAEAEPFRGMRELGQAFVEEQQQARDQNGESCPLHAPERLAEDEYGANQQHQRRELDHDLRHRGRHVVERDEVEHVVADQREPSRRRAGRVQSDRFGRAAAAGRARRGTRRARPSRRRIATRRSCMRPCPRARP